MKRVKVEVMLGFLLVGIVIGVLMALADLTSRVTKLETRLGTTIRFFALDPPVLSCDKTDEQNSMEGLRAGVTVDVRSWRARRCPSKGAQSSGTDLPRKLEGVPCFLWSPEDRWTWSGPPEKTGSLPCAFVGPTREKNP